MCNAQNTDAIVGNSVKSYHWVVSKQLWLCAFKRFVRAEDMAYLIYTSKQGKLVRCLAHVGFATFIEGLELIRMPIYQNTIAFQPNLAGLYIYHLSMISK